MVGDCHSNITNSITHISNTLSSPGTKQTGQNEKRRKIKS